MTYQKNKEESSQQTAENNNVDELLKELEEIKYEIELLTCFYRLFKKDYRRRYCE